MANNRMYIRCLFCGRTQKIGSYYLDGYEVYEKEIPKFIEEHTFCDMERDDCQGYEVYEYPLPDRDEIDCENQFDIVYENKVVW